MNCPLTRRLRPGTALRWHGSAFRSGPHAANLSLLRRCRLLHRDGGPVYPEVVDGREKEGGVPSRLLKTDAGDGRQEGTPDDVRTLPVGEGNEEVKVTLDDLAREGARRMIATALEVEVDEYVASFTEEVDEDGRRLVVRNGRGKQRRVKVGSGTLPLRAPRVNDKRVDEETGERQRFSSRILPRYARRSPRVTDVLPVLYLRGLSSGDFGPALRDLLGEDASGLSASSISRLTERWREEHQAFKRRRLDFVRYAYLFADGVHVSVRLGEDKRLCLLVIIGVREDGAKELLVVKDGYRESTDSWAEVLRDLKARGMNEPKLVTADGALGLWGALRDVFSAAREQRCWVHKTANVLDALPKRVQPQAKRMLHEIVEAATQKDAHRPSQPARPDRPLPTPTPASDPRTADPHQPTMDTPDARPLALAARLHHHPGEDPVAPHPRLSNPPATASTSRPRSRHRHAHPCPGNPTAALPRRSRGNADTRNHHQNRERPQPSGTITPTNLLTNPADRPYQQQSCKHAGPVSAQGRCSGGSRARAAPRHQNPDLGPIDRSIRCVASSPDGRSGAARSSHRTRAQMVRIADRRVALIRHTSSHTVQPPSTSVSMPPDRS